MKANKQDTIDHQALTETLLEDQGLMPDVDAEWKRQAARHESAQKIYKHIYFRGIISGIAATIVIVVAAGLFWRHLQSPQGSVITYAALPSDHQVLWQSGTAQPVSLSSNTEQTQASTVLVEQGDSLAASFLALAGTAESELVLPELQVITTPPGCSINVTLPDSTIVWLSGNSRLSFPSFFAGPQRLVSLEGEAYIKAAHDALHPLVIETKDIATRVLGTEFFVSAEAGANVHISLIEGSVEVLNAEQETLALLEPGQSVTFDSKSGSCAVGEEDMTNYVCVRDGYFYFDGVTLEEMMAELGRWYNVNVVFEDESMLDLKMRYFCRRHDNVEQAVALLNNLRRIHAKVVGETVFIK